MDWLYELDWLWVRISLGNILLVGLAITQCSGLATLLALPISALVATSSALSGTRLKLDRTRYRSRKWSDMMEFGEIWFEMLELFAACATCARAASCTLDYISHGRFREWFLGLESHSLGEPWPDVLGVLVIVVITAMFMLGLEKHSAFTVILVACATLTTAFFFIVGSFHTTATRSDWSHSYKRLTIKKILEAASLTSYGFVNTLPIRTTTSSKCYKLIVSLTVPCCVYIATALLLTLMVHYRELRYTATPLLVVFELRDVDVARLLMALGTVCVVCLSLTELFPHLVNHFVELSTAQWRIFLSSIHYRHSTTGAPVLAIFAAGSLVAILAFACPFNYLLRLLNGANVIRCTIRCLHVLYSMYGVTAVCVLTSSSLMGGGGGASRSTRSSYCKLKSRHSSPRVRPRRRAKKVRRCWQRVRCRTDGMVPPSKLSGRSGAPDAATSNTASTAVTVLQQPVDTNCSELLLMNDYTDKCLLFVDASSDDDNDSYEIESVLSSSSGGGGGGGAADTGGGACQGSSTDSSTDVDAVVEEYKQKIDISSENPFNDARRPTLATAVTVFCSVAFLVAGSVGFSVSLLHGFTLQAWICFIGAMFSALTVLSMPCNQTVKDDECATTSTAPVDDWLISICALLAIFCNNLFVFVMLEMVWLAIICWLVAGFALLLRCNCCEDILLTMPHSRMVNSGIAATVADDDDNQSEHYTINNDNNDSSSPETTLLDTSPFVR